MSVLHVDIPWTASCAGKIFCAIQKQYYLGHAAAMFERHLTSDRPKYRSPKLPTSFYHAKNPFSIYKIIFPLRDAHRSVQKTSLLRELLLR